MYEVLDLLAGVAGFIQKWKIQNKSKIFQNLKYSHGRLCLGQESIGNSSWWLPLISSGMNYTLEQITVITLASMD